MPLDWTEVVFNLQKGGNFSSMACPYRKWRQYARKDI